MTLAGCMEADAAVATDDKAVTADAPTYRTEVPTEGVTITTDTSDCPIPVTSAPSGDFEAITFIFSESMLHDARRTVRCRIGIDYQFPAGWQLWRPGAIARTANFLNERGQSVAWAVRTRRDGGAWKSATKVTQGPIEDDYVQIDLDDGEAQGEAPTECGATSAHIDLELFGGLFIPPQTSALATTDTIDTFFDWRRCP